MTRNEQRTFVRNFCNSIRDQVLRTIGQHRIPESWNSHELRELIADITHRERSLRTAYGLRGVKAYRRILLERDLDRWSESTPHPQRKPDAPIIWRVLCGNVGNVYTGREEHIARQTFHEYVSISQNGSGRAAGENVTLFKDDAIEVEYIAPEAPEE
jgi:hypothetical protein